MARSVSLKQAAFGPEREVGMQALRVGLIVAIFVAVLALPSAAQADTRYYYGSPSNPRLWPVFCCNVAATGSLLNFLNESSARTIFGNTVCAASFDENRQVDSAYVCSDDLAYKALCGCKLRGAVSRDTTSRPQPFGRARFGF